MVLRKCVLRCACTYLTTLPPNLIFSCSMENITVLSVLYCRYSVLYSMYILYCTYSVHLPYRRLTRTHCGRRSWTSNVFWFSESFLLNLHKLYILLISFLVLRQNFLRLVSCNRSLWAVFRSVLDPDPGSSKRVKILNHHTIILLFYFLRNFLWKLRVGFGSGL